MKRLRAVAWSALLRDRARGTPGTEAALLPFSVPLGAKGGLVPASEFLGAGKKPAMSFQLLGSFAAHDGVASWRVAACSIRTDG